eukprot:10140176-Alexandrium_andersonii.AAC.1
MATHACFALIPGATQGDAALECIGLGDSHARMVRADIWGHRRSHCIGLGRTRRQPRAYGLR